MASGANSFRIFFFLLINSFIFALLWRRFFIEIYAKAIIDAKVATPVAMYFKFSFVLFSFFVLCVWVNAIFFRFNLKPSNADVFSYQTDDVLLTQIDEFMGK